MRPLVLLLLVGLAHGLSADAPKVDFAKVGIEKRNGKDWCTLDSQVSGTVAASLATVLSVIQDYASYPVLFPRIKEVQVVRADGVVLLSEVVVVEALGVVNTNRFTLKLGVPERGDRTTRLAWTQERTDGTIDSLGGFWLLEDLGTADNPSVKVTYRTTSAVPVRIPGQDMVIRMFLGSETKSVVESVFKKALFHIN